MGTDYTRNRVRIRSWRDIYIQIYNNRILNWDESSSGSEDIYFFKKEVLEDAIELYEEELSSIKKWINTNFSFSILNYRIEGSEGEQVLDVPEAFPDFKSYLIIGGALFEEDDSGVIQLDEKTYSWRKEDDLFYKVIYYEQIYQDMLVKRIT